MNKNTKVTLLYQIAHGQQVSAEERRELKNTRYMRMIRIMQQEPT